MTRKLIGLLLIFLLTLSACQNGDRGPWDETFDQAGKWKINSDAAADLSIQNGKLQIHIKDAGQLAWASADRNYTNLRLKVEATLESGPLNNEYGILLRMDGDKKFYVFSMSSDGYIKISRYEEGSWTLLNGDWAPADAIKQGQATNALEVEAQGQNFTFTINGQQVAQITDEKGLTRGDIGLYAGALDEGDVVVSFDNLHIETLP